MSTQPTTKRQLAGLKTANIGVPMMPAQKEAVEAALPLIQGALNNMLAENLAGETGTSGIPSQVWIRLNADDPSSSFFTVILERVSLTEAGPSIVAATENDLKGIIKP